MSSMGHRSPFLDRIREAFRPTQRGVVGIVDDLLSLSQQMDLQLHWHDDLCRALVIGAEPEDTVQLPIPKSVFRAVLARLATLCNGQNPGSTSLYGGEGELMIGADRTTFCRVAFTNTPGAQRLEMVRIHAGHEPGRHAAPGC